MERSKRLGRLVDLQRTVKAVHEFRRAGHLAVAARAESDAEALREAAGQPSPLSGMTAALYPAWIGSALAEADAARERAAGEARSVALEKARGERLDVQRREAESAEDRTAEERERLETIEQGFATLRNRT